MKNQNNKTNAFQHKRQPQDTKLSIECTLIGGLLPFYEITYKNRRVTGYFPRNVWGNEALTIKMAQEIIEELNKTNPF